MKHVFYIHSPLNYVVAKQAINFLKLPVQDCVLLYDRIAPLSSEISIDQYNFPHTPQPAAHSFGVKIDFWKQWKRITEFDKHIKQIANNEEFIFYALFSWGNFFYLTISHPLCKGYYFMEDGTVSINPMAHFKPLKKESWLRYLLYKLNFPNRNVPSVKQFYDLTHPLFKGVLATYDYIFPNFPQKTIIGLSIKDSTKEYEYEHLLVLDGAADFGLVSHENYAKAIELLPMWFVENNIERVHVKYQQPYMGKEDSKSYSKEILNKYKDKVEFIEIPADAILEEIAFNSNANFYINGSSVGFFAFLAQRKVYTWIGLLQQFDSTYQHNPNYPKEYLKALIPMKLKETT